MEQEQQKEVDELEKVSAQIGDVKECRMCKYVLLFSFMMLLTVMLVVYMQQVKKQQSINNTATTTASFHSIAPTKEEQASTTAEFNQRVLELGQTAFGGASNGSVPTGASARIDIPTSTRKIPDGPPPVMD